MITPPQSRAARGLLNWSQDRLAREAGISLSTIRDFELGKRKPMPANARAIRQSLEAAGVELIDENGGGVGARLRKG